MSAALKEATRTARCSTATSRRGDDVRGRLQGHAGAPAATRCARRRDADRWPPMTMIQALRSAMDVMLERDDNVVIFGQDVGYFGGVFRCTDGLQAKYGKIARLRHADLRGRHRRLGDRHGARTDCGRCVEIQFADYFYPASDQIVSEAARLRYRSAGDFTAPITIRMPCGGGIYGGQTHSQSPEALFTHVCGIRTVMPSQSVRRQGPADRVDRERRPGHLPRAQAALQRPVRRPPRQAGRAVVGAPDRRGAGGPLHRAARARRRRSAPGADVTVLTYGTMVFVSEAAARETGIDAEIIDLRSLWPLDLRPIVESVQEDGPLRHRPRGDAHERLRRRAGRARPGALLLSPRGADRARHRLGHAVSARAGVGVLPGAGPRRRGAASA